MIGFLPYTLVGIVDPSGMSLGFQIPLFNYPLTNALFIQTLDESGIIAGFETYDVQAAPLIPTQAMQKNVGEAALYVFSFGEGDTEFATFDDNEVLAQRLDDPILIERPLLAMELADFLNLTDRRCEFAARAHADMQKASQEIADHWRDLSVLTAEIRRELMRSSTALASRLAEAVVARVRGRIVQMAGVPEGTNTKQLKLVEQAAVAALTTLAPLYPLPDEGWEVNFTRHRERLENKTLDAALLIASPRAMVVGSDAFSSSKPKIEVFTQAGPEFVRLVEEAHTPIFVAYDTEEPRQMAKAFSDQTVSRMHGIGINGARSRPYQLDWQNWHVTHVRGPAIFGGSPKAELGIGADVRLAIAAELDRRASRVSWDPKSTVLLRTRGLSSDPESDAWATLYDRAWAIGAAPWNSLLIAGQGRMPILSGRDLDWVAEALFEVPRYLRRNLVNDVMERTRSTAAMLLDTTRRSATDNVRHQATIARLLERQGWKISDRTFTDTDADFVILGDRARITFRIGDEHEGTGNMSSLDLSDIDLRELRGVAVTCSASTGAVLDRLAKTGELAVNVRDLVNFSASEATTLSLVGAQLRRMVTGLTSRNRTRFLVLLFMHAYRRGNVEENESNELRNLLESADLGDKLHFSVSSVAYEHNKVAAIIRVVGSGEGSRTSPEKGRGRRLRLLVSPDTISVENKFTYRL